MGRYSAVGSSATNSCTAPTSNRMPNALDNIEVCVCVFRMSSICVEDAIILITFLGEQYDV